MHPFFSPFDALSISHGIYTEEDARRAHKTCLKKCHPDRRTRKNISQVRWPTTRHIDDALHQLLNSVKAGDIGDLLEEYSSYPSTNPLRELFTPLPRSFKVCLFCNSIDRSCSCDAIQRVSLPFATCEFCYMIVKEEHYNQHIENDHSPCRSCNQRTDGIRLVPSPPNNVCNSCLTASYKHTTNEFTGYEATTEAENEDQNTACPISLPCSFRVTADTLEDHLTDDHSWLRCDGCMEGMSIKGDHLMNEHIWLECPFTSCTLIDSRNLRQHLFMAHQYRRCISCPETENELFHASGHIVGHFQHHCPRCEKTFTRLAFGDHLVAEHLFFGCPYCPEAFFDLGTYDIHIDEHRLQECQECSETLPTAGLRKHMIQDHSYVDCPLCTDVFQKRTVFNHIQEAHQQCPSCDYMGSRMELRHHVAIHDIAPCGHCSAIIPISKLQEHIQDNHSRQHNNSTSQPTPEINTHRKAGLSRLKCASCLSKIKCITSEGQIRCDACIRSAKDCSTRTSIGWGRGGRGRGAKAV